MNLVHLLPVGEVEGILLEQMRSAIRDCFQVRCEISAAALDPKPSYHPERQQYHSSEILQRMQTLFGPADFHVLGITAVDLYIPILQYVFGEAQLGGRFAVVSFHRLRQQFYGLEGDDTLLAERLGKEAIHELGHTVGLRHCQDYRCAMASAHAVEWIDLREGALCHSCRKRVEVAKPLYAKE
jgi:archaemetzincin